jgi:hypothetical protein
MAQDDTSESKIRMELLDGTVEATGTPEFVRKAQTLFAKLAHGGEIEVAALEPDETPDSLPPNPLDTTMLATDIRSLRDEKQPRNQIEMAALVAYYVSNVLPAAERRDTIAATDITKYFGQAGYQSTTPARMTLFNAKTAGYLDASSTGKYKLNPVGYNLVTAGLPADGVASKRRSPYGRRKTRKKAAAKTTRKKK